MIKVVTGGLSTKIRMNSISAGDRRCYIALQKRVFDLNLALSGGPRDPGPFTGFGYCERRLAADPVYHATYVKYVGETIEKTFYPDRMRPIYKAAHDMIRPYVVGDEREMAGYTLLVNKANFDKGLAFLSQHVQDRFEAAQSFLNK